MKSAELLKLIRNFTGKTQTEFIEGILSESYYSKVERGVHQIDAEDFFEIINKNYWSPRLQSNIAHILIQGKNTKILEKITHETPRTDEEKATAYIKKLYRKLKENKQTFSQGIYLELLQVVAGSRAEILDEEDKDLLRVDLKKVKMNQQLLMRIMFTTPLYSEDDLVKIMKLVREYVSVAKKYFPAYLKFAQVITLNMWNKRYSKSNELMAEFKKMLNFVKETDPRSLTNVFIKIYIFNFGQENLGNADPQVDQAITNVLESISPKNNRPNN